MRKISIKKKRFFISNIEYFTANLINNIKINIIILNLNLLLLLLLFFLKRG